MFKVYCDTGAYRAELTHMEKRGSISLHQFKYENRNRKIRNCATPSRPTWKEDQSTWEEDAHLTWSDYNKQSDKWAELLQLIGSGNRLDAKHLDSAYMEGCTLFLSSDKGDIVSRRNEIESLLSITVLHYQDDWHEFLSMVEAGG